MGLLEESVKVLGEFVGMLAEYKQNGSNKKRVNVRGQDGKKTGRKKMTHGNGNGERRGSRMNDPLMIAQARANGVCFLCAMCKHWHEGVELGLKDDMLEPRCSVQGCCGPVWGGNFAQYAGPLKGNLHSWCYLCGQKSTHVAVPNMAQMEKIGVCSACAEKLKIFTAKETRPGSVALVIAEHRAAPDRFEVEA